MSARGVASAAEVFAEPLPCDHCPAFKRCRDEHLACDAFRAYLVTGRRLSPHVRVTINSTSAAVVGHGPISPTRKKYRDCFAGSKSK